MREYHVIKQQDIFESPKYPIFVSNYYHTSTNRHSHDFYELVYVKEGFCMHYLDDFASLALEGDLLLIKSGMQHKYTGTKVCKIFNCLFTSATFEQSVLDELLCLPGMAQILQPSEETIPHIHLGMTERKTISDLLNRMVVECTEKKNGWYIKVRSMLYELMVEYSRIYEVHHQNHSEKNCYSGYVTRALSYIDEHYSEETLTVQKLSEQVGISGDYLSRQFRKMTGIPVQEYIRRYRLSRAVNYLHQCYTVGDTAKLCGFHSIGYFSREFKKEMGVIPSHSEKVY